ncbi:uncharacterized protein ARMOST_21671 [Armillaria ostoyae]|uniref:Uncharacterized protein n=1 Tax=Armillaria ostoyae TaxID=47428 RepID=A0A284SAW0_ARMOS|nr:uncharacterized protein ARMOST_21671 [Armillaria ostoyae]
MLPRYVKADVAVHAINTRAVFHLTWELLYIKSAVVPKCGLSVLPRYKRLFSLTPELYFDQSLCGLVTGYPLSSIAHIKGNDAEMLAPYLFTNLGSGSPTQGALAHR